MACFSASDVRQLPLFWKPKRDILRVPDGFDFIADPEEIILQDEHPVVVVGELLDGADGHPTVFLGYGGIRVEVKGGDVVLLPLLLIL